MVTVSRVDPISGEAFTTDEEAFRQATEDESRTALVPYDDRFLPETIEPLAMMVEPLVNETGSKFIHLAMARKLNVTEETLSEYVDAAWVDVKALVNQAVTVTGAIVWFSGPFSPQAEAEKPKEQRKLGRGYYKLLFKTTRYRTIKVPIGNKVHKFRQYMVFATSAKKICELGLTMIENHGWYDWEQGVTRTMVITGDESNGYAATLIDLSKLGSVEAGNDGDDDDDDDIAAEE